MATLSLRRLWTTYKRLLAEGGFGKRDLVNCGGPKQGGGSHFPDLALEVGGMAEAVFRRDSRAWWRTCGGHRWIADRVNYLARR